ncbi:MAG: hypothetical protein WKG01_00425 [Kofleriaceae bacterium]
MLRFALCGVLVACSSPSKPAPVPARASNAEITPTRKAQLMAAHRELEDEQQTALAATCTSSRKQPRCEPSCYEAEPPDPRAGKQHVRAEISHLVCRPAGRETGQLVFADEIGGTQVMIRAARGAQPKAHKAGWEAGVARAVRVALQPEVARGDVIRVTGAWTERTHPVTQEALRCVTVSHHVAVMRAALDPCGGRGAIACEATGNAAVHGINVVHYRLGEARRLHAAGDDPGCQRASLEAIAVARGLPRWRQYVTLNVNKWRASPRYRTRFDGILDEETLFTTAMSLGREAEVVHTSCGGAAHPPPDATREQSFHTCR